MSGFINLDSDIIKQYLGQEIEYFALWDVSIDTFFAGRSFMHGIYSDKTGQIKIYSDLIWGNSLDDAQLRTDFDIFCIQQDKPLYLGPAPFEIYRVDYEDNYGEMKVKYVPAESDMDLALTCGIFTNKPYTTTRVNLDLTTFYDA